MKNLQITLFLFGFVVLGTQSMRHVYVKWIAPRSSVLDAFREPVDTAIASADSLEELAALYQQARDRVRQYESNPANPNITDRWDTEPYASERKVRQEIESREARIKSLFELRFFWSLGLLSVLGGAWCHRRLNAWLGLAAVIAGFSEMAYWTSPLSSVFEGPEFETLLGSKLLLSVVSWLLLVTMWLSLDKWGLARDAATRSRPT